MGGFASAPAAFVTEKPGRERPGLSNRRLWLCGLDLVVLDIDLHCFVDVEDFDVFVVAFHRSSMSSSKSRILDIRLRSAASAFDAAADVVAHFVEFVLLLPVFGRIVGDLDVAVILHTGTGRDEASHDDVFLEAA